MELISRTELLEILQRMEKSREGKCNKSSIIEKMMIKSIIEVVKKIPKKEINE